MTCNSKPMPPHKACARQWIALALAIATIVTLGALEFHETSHRRASDAHGERIEGSQPGKHAGNALPDRHEASAEELNAVVRVYQTYSQCRITRVIATMPGGVPAIPSSGLDCSRVLPFAEVLQLLRQAGLRGSDFAKAQYAVEVFRRNDEMRARAERLTEEDVSQTDLAIRFLEYLVLSGAEGPTLELAHSYASGAAGTVDPVRANAYYLLASSTNPQRPMASAEVELRSALTAEQRAESHELARALSREQQAFVGARMQNRFEFLFGAGASQPPL